MQIPGELWKLNKFWVIYCAFITKCKTRHYYPSSGMADAVCQALAFKGQKTKNYSESKGEKKVKHWKQQHSHQLLVSSSLLDLKGLPLGMNRLNWQPLHSLLLPTACPVTAQKLPQSPPHPLGWGLGRNSGKIRKPLGGGKQPTQTGWFQFRLVWLKNKQFLAFLTTFRHTDCPGSTQWALLICSQG